MYSSLEDFHLFFNLRFFPNFFFDQNTKMIAYIFGYYIIVHFSILLLTRFFSWFFFLVLFIYPLLYMYVCVLKYNFKIEIMFLYKRKLKCFFFIDFSFCFFFHYPVFSFTKLGLFRVAKIFCVKQSFSATIYWFPFFFF